MANESDEFRRPGRTALIAFLLASFAAAGLGSRFAPDEWYRGLEKPAFNPPGAVFGPVWTVLYAMMAVAAWQVWRQRWRSNTRRALTAWVVQLILNACWSWLFFGRHDIGLALAEIVLLGIAILVTTILFWQVSRPAGLLMLPYLAWVGFATVLNAAFWQLNR